MVRSWHSSCVDAPRSLEDRTPHRTAPSLSLKSPNAGLDVRVDLDLWLAAHCSINPSPPLIQHVYTHRQAVARAHGRLPLPARSPPGRLIPSTSPGAAAAAGPPAARLALPAEPARVPAAGLVGLWPVHGRGHRPTTRCVRVGPSWIGSDPTTASTVDPVRNPQPKRPPRPRPPRRSRPWPAWPRT